jgi:hypothetical protein
LVPILDLAEEDFPCPIFEVEEMEERTGDGGAWANNVWGERRGREESTIDGKGEEGPATTPAHMRDETRRDERSS